MRVLESKIAEIDPTTGEMLGSDWIDPTAEDNVGVSGG